MSEFDFDDSRKSQRDLRVRHSFGFLNGFGFGCGLFAAFLAVILTVLFALGFLAWVQYRKEINRTQTTSRISSLIDCTAFHS